MSRTIPLCRWLLSTAVLTALLYMCAGRTDAPVLRTYIAIFAGMGLLTALATDSSLEQERRKAGPASVDTASRVAASALFLATVTVAALDRGRLHWTHIITRLEQIVVLIVLILAAGFQVWAMAVNPFFSSAIRIQTERGHELVTRGPYRFVRHPGYLAMAISMPATALALGSMTALIPALCYSGLIVHRTRREDIFLIERLQGYAGYREVVRSRLIPRIW